MVASGVSRWELPSNRMAVNLAVLRVRDYLNRESPHDARTCGISGSRKYALSSPGERPGQDLNLRGVTQRFSRPPPYRARRPGQRFILKTKARISVSDPRHKIDARNRVGHTTDSMRVISGVIAPGLKDFGFPEARGRRPRQRRTSEPL